MDLGKLLQRTDILELETSSLKRVLIVFLNLLLTINIKHLFSLNIFLICSFLPDWAPSWRPLARAATSAISPQYSNSFLGTKFWRRIKNYTWPKKGIWKIIIYFFLLVPELYSWRLYHCFRRACHRLRCRSADSDASWLTARTSARSSLTWPASSCTFHQP